jgi:hypothetical protein
MIEPEIVGKGRGSENKYSLINLYQLAYIERLAKFGIEFNFIKKYTEFSFCQKGISKGRWKKLIAKKVRTVFDLYKEEKYQKGGLLFWIFKGKGKEVAFLEIFTRNEIVEILNKYFDPKHPERKFSEILLINTGEIINEIEEKTGEKF